MNEAIAGFLIGPKIFDATDKLIEVKAGQTQTADKLDNPIFCLFLFFQKPHASKLGIITAAA